MRSPRIRVMSALLAMFAAFALVAGACSSDKSDSSDGDDNDSASAENSTGNDDTDSGDADTTDGDSAPSGDFNETVSAAIADVNNATDACELYSAVATLSAVGNPTTQDEVKQAVDFYVTMLNKMSETSSDPDIAETLKTGAADFQAYAESVDYDPEQMDLNGAGPDMENSEELDAAMDEYGATEFVQCDELAGLVPPGAVDPDAQPEG